MEVSCGFYLVDKRTGLLLIGHITNTPNSFSIPKGLKDLGESDWDAAVRELREETSIEYHNLNVIYQYEFDLVKYEKYPKQLKAYLSIFDNDMPYTHCSSMFLTKEGVEMPEIDYFKWVTINEAYSYLTGPQLINLKQIEEHVNKTLG